MYINLKSIEEYINYQYNDLKEYMNNKSIVLKHDGFIGYFIRLMAHFLYDIKYYYDKMIQETFPIHAKDNKNLLFHSKFWGYDVKYGKPSILNGNFVCNFNILPIPSLSCYKREIIFRDPKFIINGLNFNLDSSYKIIQTRKNINEWYYIGNISTELGTEKYSIDENFRKIKIKELYQYEIEEIDFQAPAYVKGSFYQNDITSILDSYIYKIEAEVKEYNSDEFKKFDVSFTKEFFGNDDYVLFANLSTDNELTIELGNGIKGVYIPLSNVIIKIYKTTGKIGNIKNIQNLLITGQIQIIDYDNENIPISSDSRYFPIDNFIKINLIEAYGGIDMENGENLRVNLLKYIQSRNNLINEIDYKNKLDVIFGKDYELIFKKINYFDNSFMIYTLLKDKYENITKTITISYLYSTFQNFEEINHNTNDKYIYKPKEILNGRKFISPYIYIYDSFLNLYKGYIENKERFTPNDIGIVDNNFDILNIFMEVEYVNADTIRFWVKSYNDITNVNNINIKINKLNIDSELYLNEDSYYINYYNGLFFDGVDILLTINNNIYFFNNIKLFIDVSDNILIKKYNDYGIYKILNFPLIEENTFNEDEQYYTDKLLKHFSEYDFGKKRMIGDDIEVRLLNTYMIQKEILKQLTIQNYEFDLFFPLKLKINLILDKIYIQNNNIDFVKEFDDFTLYIGEILINEYTGNHIKFYKSKLIDYIHNIGWIKSCNVYIFDDNNYEIPNGNIETIVNEEFIKEIDKNNFLDYSPPFFYWDINNIDIGYEK